MSKGWPLRNIALERPLPHKEKVKTLINLYLEFDMRIPLMLIDEWNKMCYCKTAINTDNTGEGKSLKQLVAELRARKGTETPNPLEAIKTAKMPINKPRGLFWF